ncbi:RRXRR domain-containing protein [Polaromonas hydrogenivorans]|uniref:RRXRR domain-containing protein n=1 Tax=Polaromonas hydrogenivorans TaxID=335476 RepID=UPI0039EF6617
MAVFVLDRSGRPLMPCTEKRARLLLERGRARVHKVMPFTIRVVDRLAEDSEFQALRVKLDPGSKTTGMALVRETAQNGVAVINLFELMHRGKQISEALTARPWAPQNAAQSLALPCAPVQEPGQQKVRLAGAKPATPG